MEQFIKRAFWLDLIETAWSHRRILWLAGVRRAGKTSLAHTLGDTEYFDCELPRTRRMMSDPEDFLSSLKGKRVILDEIHRLRSPAELLKIAADHFPSVKVLATGSSTLGASRKFRDTLTGRKTNIWLTPMIHEDLGDFGKEDLKHRLFLAGFLLFFSTQNFPKKIFRNGWMIIGQRTFRNFSVWTDGHLSNDLQN